MSHWQSCLLLTLSANTVAISLFYSRVPDFLLSTFAPSCLGALEHSTKPCACQRMIANPRVPTCVLSVPATSIGSVQLSIRWYTLPYRQAKHLSFQRGLPDHLPVHSPIVEQLCRAYFVCGTTLHASLARTASARDSKPSSTDFAPPEKAQSRSAQLAIERRSSKTAGGRQRRC